MLMIFSLGLLLILISSDGKEEFKILEYESIIENFISWGAGGGWGL